MRPLRDILTGLGLAAALLVVAVPSLAVQTVLDPNTIPKFVDPIVHPPAILGVGTTPASPVVITMSEFQQRILPASMYPPGYEAGTYVWGYNGIYPGPTLIALRGTPLDVRYLNNLYHPDGSPLVLQEFMPPDMTTTWANPLSLPPSGDVYTGPIPACVHLHGGEVPSPYDGGPDEWYTPAGHPSGQIKGLAYVSDLYRYPNEQEACTMFYHDHALGMTSKNVYSGLAAFYLVLDPANTIPGLPVGALTGTDQWGQAYDFGMAFQDKSFDTNGQQYFDSEGINPEHPSWVPEMFGNTIVVNGRTWPYMRVEPRRYRMRIVNGCTARFFRYHLETEHGGPGPAMWQIASDQGFLDHPVRMGDLTDPASAPITHAPGERVEIVVDFSGFAGEELLVVNDARTPFPDGDDVDANTRLVMKFKVGTTVTGGSDPSVPMSEALNLRPTNPIEHIAPGLKVRQLTLNEHIGEGGPLGMTVNNTNYMMTPTEAPVVGDTEIWEIVNLTADTHPMHTHLMAIQLLNRQDFDVAGYEGAYGMPMFGNGPPMGYLTMDASTGFKLGGNPDVSPYLQGAPIPPDDNERGWKDTFRMNPGQVTRILVRLAPTDADAKAAALVPPQAVVPGLNLYPFEPWTSLGQTDSHGYPGGEGYVWHCHITDHEDNEMMRPLLVTRDVVVGTTLVRFDAVPSETGVRVTWELAGDGRAIDATLERSAAQVGPWSRVNSPIVVLGTCRVVDDPEISAAPSWYRLVVRNGDGTESKYGPILADGVAGLTFALGKVAPNPSNGPVGVEFSVANQTHVRLAVLDVQGREVAKLADGMLRPGRYAMSWDGAGPSGPVRSGIYFLRYSAAGHEYSRRVAITR